MKNQITDSPKITKKFAKLTTKKKKSINKY